MSKLKDNRELLMCDLILKHYRFIKKMNDMSVEEFCDYIYNINPAAYSAFKNKENGIASAKSIISDYCYLIKSSVKSMKNTAIRCTDKNKTIHQRNYKLISLLYINKKILTEADIESKCGISKSNLCKSRIIALKSFSQVFNSLAEKLDYKNALSNVDVRIIEIMRLHQKAVALQESA